MAWPTLRTFKDAAAVTRQAIIGTTATAGEDKPLYNPVFGPDGSDPTVVVRTAGLPVVGQRLSGSPVSGKAQNATASSGATGNASAAIGGTGGTAVPGTFIVTADPDNADIVSIGDTSANAAVRSGTTRYAQGLILAPGQAVVVDTDDLRAWKLAVRVANDQVCYLKVGP